MKYFKNKNKMTSLIDNIDNVIRILNVHHWWKREHLKRSNLSFCLGMTLFYKTKITKNNETLAACHYLADILSHNNIMAEEDYLDDAQLLSELMILITKENPYIPNLIFEFIETGFAGIRRDNIIKTLVLLSIYPETHNYTLNSVIISTINRTPKIIALIKDLLQYLEELHYFNELQEVNVISQTEMLELNPKYKEHENQTYI